MKLIQRARSGYPQRRPGALLLACLLLVTGCTYLPTRPEPPLVSLVDLQLVEATLFEQQYLLHLRLQNPNDFALPIEGMRYTLTINDREFASGVSGDMATLPPFGETVVAVSVISNLFRIYEQLRDPHPDREGFTYAIEGRLSLRGLPTTLPFRHTGEIPLGLK